MNPNLLEIGLIRAFVAIYDTGSVTLAAERLFLTQPTVSYSLSRLREVLNDRLFVRDGRSMTPTLRADECYAQFSQILRQIDDVVSQGQGFDPAVSDRRFRIAMSDIATLAFFPPVMQALHQRAPNVEVEVVQPRIEDIPDYLATGKIDVAIGNLPTVSRVTASSLLMREHYVCLMSEAHSTIGNTLSKKQFLAARHVNVSSEFTGHTRLEQALREAGAQRRISVQIKQFTVLPYLLRPTDYLAVTPSQVSKVFVEHGGLKELPLPIDIPEIEVRVHWDEAQGKNAPQKWFCDVIHEALNHL